MNNNNKIILLFQVGIRAPDLGSSVFAENSSHRRRCPATAAATVAIGVVDRAERCAQLRRIQRRNSLRKKRRHAPPCAVTVAGACSPRA